MLKGVKNIVFDLGGVIIDIDFDLTILAFADMSKKSFDTVQKIVDDAALYDIYERGDVDSAEFLRLVKNALKLYSYTDEEIYEAWNSLLIDIPKSRIDMLIRLKKKYNIYALSNTNEFHVDGFNEILYNNTGQKDLHSIFHKVFFSYEMKSRKPDREIYDMMIKKTKMVPSETLFIDDNLDNIEAAEKLGFQTLWIEEGDEITELLEKA